MATKKQPQDHKSKSEFAFHIGESRYTLPPSVVAKSKLSGADLMDAALNGEAGQLAYIFKALQAVADKATLAALRALPQVEMLAILRDWGQFGDGDGASLGK